MFRTCPFLIIAIPSWPANVRCAVGRLPKPSPGRTRRLMRRWSCSTMLLRYLIWRSLRDTVKRYALWYLIQGVLLIAAGILAIIYPVLSSAAVVVLLGWLLIISGVVQGLSLIGARQVPHFWLQLISVILAVLIGCLFLRDPAQGLVTIALLLIVFFMIEGISKVVFALTIRPSPNWGWVLASGL